MVFPAGLEPATFRVLGGRDNHYTTETFMKKRELFCNNIHSPWRLPRDFKRPGCVWSGVENVQDGGRYTPKQRVPIRTRT